MKGVDLVAVVADGVAGLEVDDLERVAQAPVDDAHRAHERDGPGRAVDGQRRLAVAQLEGLEHPRQPEPVVGVVVGQEDRLHVGQPDGAQQLALGALAAVEEQPVAAASQQRRREPTAGGRHRASGAGEEEREVHAGQSRVPPDRRANFAPCPGWPTPSRSSASSSCAATSSTSRSRSSSARRSRPWSTRSSKDLITPIIAALFGKPDFSNLAFTINDSRFAYGDFLNAVLTFVLVAAALFFFVVKPVNYLMERRRTGPDVESTTRDCPECLSAIPIAALALRVLHVRGGAGVGLPRGACGAACARASRECKVSRGRQPAAVARRAPRAPSTSRPSPKTDAQPSAVAASHGGAASADAPARDPC